MPESNSTSRRGAELRLPSAFSHLISPVGVEEFFTRYWEREHLVLHRKDPGYYADLLTLADMDHLIATSRVRSSDLRVMADGEPTPISELISEIGNGANAREAVYREYRKGGTINLLFLEQHWNALERLCRSMTEVFSALIHINSYLTPADTQGLTEHHDTHDVFVAQVYGSKRWRLYPQQTRLPLQGQRYRRPADGAGEPIADFTLHPGDLLYMPRGTVHAAVSNDRASLHLTIGVATTTWAEVLQQAVTRAVEGDVRFREALPVGFAVDEEPYREAERRAGTLLRAVADIIRPESMVESARVRALLARRPEVDGHLLDLEALDSVGLGTKVLRRAPLAWTMDERPDGKIALLFNGKEVNFPGHVVDELRFTGETDVFTPADIPGQLDESGRLVLVKTLLREGFLTLPRPPRLSGTEAEADAG
jgi:hypothetical protein